MSGWKSRGGCRLRARGRGGRVRNGSRVVVWLAKGLRLCMPDYSKRLPLASQPASQRCPGHAQAHTWPAAP